jgi:hypothetical protein
LKIQTLDVALVVESGLFLVNARSVERIIMPDNNDEKNVLPDALHTCPCGYTLRAAWGFLGQKEVSRMLLSHIQSMHGVAN